MRRILIVILLAILLLPAPMPSKPETVAAGPLLLSARSTPLSEDDPRAPAPPPLLFQAAWILRSDNPGFGGLSSLRVDPPGQVLALSDSGVLTGFHVGDGAATRRPFIAPLPVFPQDRDKPWWWWDSESMAHDPATDRYWIGFELQQMICRYSSGFARVEACRVWPEILAWPKTGSIESLARLPDGRFIAIAEMGMTAQGDHDMLLFAGDPADPATPAPMRLRYVQPRGYRPTDAVVIDARHMLVLNRRITMQDLFTATIALVDLPARFTSGMRLEARVLLTLAPPLLADNFEGIATTSEGGRTMVWIISDDNHENFQRTLLVKFALPKGLLR